MTDAGPTVPRHPLVRRLVEELGVSEVGAADVDGFLAAPGNALLFFTEDPLQYPESADVAAILPQLMGAFPGRFRSAVVAREAERELQARFGFARWPALVCVRGGEIVGTITGVHDWGDFTARLGTLLDAPTRREAAVAAARANAAAAAEET